MVDFVHWWIDNVIVRYKILVEKLSPVEKYDSRRMLAVFVAILRYKDAR